MICSEEAEKIMQTCISIQLFTDYQLTITVTSELCVVSSGFSSPSRSMRSMIPVNISALASNNDAAV